MLQTKYSLMVNDNMRWRAALEEARTLLTEARQAHAAHAKRMETDEFNMQKRLGAELLTLEEALTQTRKENELLRIEYEQNVAANEQTGPINKEMRSLITTLQTNNKLLKSDNVRCKKRVEEATRGLDAAKRQITQLQSQVQVISRNQVPGANVLDRWSSSFINN
jgi:E3 ubiquitin-protein ligase BRE1